MPITSVLVQCFHQDRDQEVHQDVGKGSIAHKPTWYMWLQLDRSQEWNLLQSQPLEDSSTLDREKRHNE